MEKRFKVTQVSWNGAFTLFSFILIVFLLFIFQAEASPFLVCEPHPANEQITGFVGVLDGLPFQTPIQIHSTGTEIIYDLATLDNGIHHFTEIRAINMRGQSPPVPFDLPAIPSSPSHTRISP